MNKDIIEQKLLSIISKVTEMEFTSNVPLSGKQLDLLKELNIFCANQVLDDGEVLRDPKKLIYKTNHELKYALTAVCLARSLINPHTRNYETRDFFETNISISSSEDGYKTISFGAINPEEVKAAIYPEIIHDWIIYRDKYGRGINALMDEKTHLDLLENFQRGGEAAYEFARFERKLSERRFKKEDKAKENAQETFRNVMVQAVAAEIAKQQLAAGNNPLELVNMLFSPKDYDKAIKQLCQPQKPTTENNLLEDHTSSSDPK